ncbi:hypothetical protein [Sphingomonas sp. 66-10]|nr:hypothetical protein [Sphingomonas sp. 66-10]
MTLFQGTQSEESRLVDGGAVSGEVAVDMAVRAWLVVTSRDLSAGAIAARLSLSPDNIDSAGEPIKPGGGSRIESVWKRELSPLDSRHFGTEGLSAAIEALGIELAGEFRSLRDSGATCLLDIVQEVVGEFDSASTGFRLDASAVRWLDAGGFSVSIDQYFYE